MVHTLSGNGAPVAGSLLASSLLSLLALSGCAGPPPVDEPTGEATEQAWTIAVGEDSLELTLGHIYAMGLSSRDAAAVVESRDLELGELFTDDDAQSGPEDDLVLTSTLELADQLGAASTSTTDELDALIGDRLHDAQLLTPSAAVSSHTLALTAVTAASHDLEEETTVEDDEFSAACPQFRIGVDAETSGLEEALADSHGCEPEETSVAAEDELVSQLITGELDAALITSTHPAIEDHAFFTVSGAEGELPQWQHVPLVQDGIADQVPEVAEEIADRLDAEAMVTLRRLLTGEDGLSPEQAAEYWLVEQELVAAPEDWG